MAFYTKTVFYPDQDTPIEVSNDIDNNLCPDFEVGNDSYIEWSSESYGEDYPIIDEYLLENNITSCLIKVSW